MWFPALQKLTEWDALEYEKGRENGLRVGREIWGAKREEKGYGNSTEEEWKYRVYDFSCLH